MKLALNTGTEASWKLYSPDSCSLQRKRQGLQYYLVHYVDVYLLSLATFSEQFIVSWILFAKTDYLTKLYNGV